MAGEVRTATVVGRWNLFGVRGGNSGSSGQSKAQEQVPSKCCCEHSWRVNDGRRLIRAAAQGRPHDVMGFQECDDVQRAFAPGLLLGQVSSASLQAPHGPHEDQFPAGQGTTEL